MAGHVHLLYSDKVLGEMLQRQLRSEFFHVTLSQETAPEAMIAALTHEQPEVIGLIRGPNTPFERFRMLKQAFPHRALVALDPIHSKASSLAALHQGADGSIALPQAPALLSLQMGAWLRQSRKQEEAAANDDVMRLLGFDPLLLAVPSEQLGGLCLEVRHEDPASAAVLVQRLGETGFHCDPQPLSDPSTRQAPGRAKDGLVIGALSRDGWHRALGLIAQERGRAATRTIPLVIVASVLPAALRAAVAAVEAEVVWTGAVPDHSFALGVRQLIRGNRLSIQRRKALLQSLDLALTDGLTGLYNQRYLAAHLPMQMQLARQSKRALSLVLLDLDGFKGLNDSFGHLAGDQFLISVASHLRSNSRSADSAIRLGGDEFAMILPNAGAAAARAVVERLVQDIADIDHAGRQDDRIRISASAGVVTMQSKDWSSTADALLAAADNRLYAAKEKGGNQIVDTAP